MHYRTGNRSRILCCLRILAAAVLILLSVTAQGGFSVFAAPGEITNASDGAAENGWLSVRGTQLVNEKGQAVVLHGMSSHGLQWFSQFTTADAIGATAAYGANLFRIAVYTVQGGYLSRRSAMLKKLYRAVDAAISRNMYVIIDWHILKDGNPKKHQKAAKDFFRKVSRRYGKTPNVIYEICNEPNKKGTWKRIRSYANSPLPYPNLMYTCHFFFFFHGEWLRGKVREALGRGLPVFISEWGSSRASGSGGVYTEEADRWISFMEQHKLSWTNWSFCNKAESSAALDAKANPEDGLTPEELSASGRYVFSRF